MDLFEEAMTAVREDAAMFGVTGACPVSFEPGQHGSKVLLISGDNAGGKSLVCKYVESSMHRDADEHKLRIEFMRIGMQLRSSGGMQRAFIFGDEGSESTGQITVHSILGAIRTSKGRTSAHMVCLDEPDIGLSEGYQAAVGETLHAYAADLPKHSVGLIVVTHSRPIASRLMTLAPHAMRVGDDLRPTASWIQDGPLPRSVEDLESLGQRATERFRAITRIQKERKAERAARGTSSRR